MLKFIIQQAIKKDIKDQKSLEKLKREAVFLWKKEIPTHRQLLKEYRKLVENKSIQNNSNLEKLFQKRSIRTLSGIAAITVITKPFSCPGKCIYCPQEKNMPKSYLSNEPACMRAVLNKFHPYRQVAMRLKALSENGHSTDKIELIVLGGTWSVYPKKYQNWFIKSCFDACNKEKSKNLKESQIKNEKAKHRIVGLTLETRPDYINIEEIKKMRSLGCTRVELGVQSIDEKILKHNRRGHSIKKTIEATKILKDAGLKINYHIMINLPGSNPEKDIRTFDDLFNNQDFQPDLLKIYPCVVLKNSPLYKIWKKGDYNPYSDEKLKEILLAIKQKLPRYVRAVRIIRDIPKESIKAGSKISNLRQLLYEEMKKRELKCQCIRCREIQNKTQSEKLFLFREDYQASDGKEIFLSFEDKNREHLYALLRLRLPSQLFSKEKHFIPALQDASIIREVHTYGQMAPISKEKSKKTIQHTGLGKKLIEEAETICRKEKIKKIAIISGVGVRNYYRKIGYNLKETYLIKKIK